MFRPVQVRSDQHSSAMQNDVNYQSFAVRHMPVSGGASKVPVYSSPSGTVKQNVDQLGCTANSVEDGSRYALSNIGGCCQPSNRSFSQIHDNKYPVQNTVAGLSAETTHT